MDPITATLPAKIPNRRPKKSEYKGFLFIRHIPDELKAEFKEWCAIRDIDMTDVWIALMTECVRADSELGEKALLRAARLKVMKTQP